MLMVMLSSRCVRRFGGHLKKGKFMYAKDRRPPLATRRARPDVRVPTLPWGYGIAFLGAGRPLQICYH
jgi:hypothetical protein